MKLNIRLALVAGLIWGVIAILLGLLQGLIGGIFSQTGLGLDTFGVLFAGVHFVARNKGGILEDLIGGVIAAIIASLLLMLAGMIGIGTVGGGDALSALLRGLISGLVGALGMILVKRINIG